jgi:hypothetical protein
MQVLFFVLLVRQNPAAFHMLNFDKETLRINFLLYDLIEIGKRKVKCTLREKHAPELRSFDALD